MQLKFLPDIKVIVNEDKLNWAASVKLITTHLLPFMTDEVYAQTCMLYSFTKSALSFCSIKLLSKALKPCSQLDLSDFTFLVETF